MLNKELDELTSLYSAVTSEVFETHILSKIKGELENLVPAYECESLREMATLKGKAKAYKKVLNILDKETLEQRIIHLKAEIEKLDKEA